MHNAVGMIITGVFTLRECPSMITIPGMLSRASGLVNPGVTCMKVGMLCQHLLWGGGGGGGGGGGARAFGALPLLDPPLATCKLLCTQILAEMTSHPCHLEPEIVYSSDMHTISILELCTECTVYMYFMQRYCAFHWDVQL